jgi:hypothetical protein
LPGCSPLSPDDAFTERYGVPVLTSYAATEFAGGVAGWNLPDYQRYAKGKRGSVGRAQPGTALRVVDPDSGAVRPPDEPGDPRSGPAAPHDLGQDRSAGRDRATASGAGPMTGAAPTWPSKWAFGLEPLPSMLDFAAAALPRPLHRRRRLQPGLSRVPLLRAQSRARGRLVCLPAVYEGPAVPTPGGKRSRAARGPAPRRRPAVSRGCAFRPDVSPACAEPVT